MLEQFGGPQGEPEKRSPWNQGERGQFFNFCDQQRAVDGGNSTIAEGSTSGKPAF